MILIKLVIKPKIVMNEAKIITHDTPEKVLNVSASISERFLFE
jgi:hypothetical protein